MSLGQIAKLLHTHAKARSKNAAVAKSLQGVLPLIGGVLVLCRIKECHQSLGRVGLDQKHNQSHGNTGSEANTDVLEPRPRHEEYCQGNSRKQQEHGEVGLQRQEQGRNGKRHRRLDNGAFQGLDLGTCGRKCCANPGNQAQLQDFGGLDSPNPAVGALDATARHNGRYGKDGAHNKHNP